MPDRHDDDLYDDDPRAQRDPRASRRRAQPPRSGEGVRIIGTGEPADSPEEGDARATARFPLPEDEPAEVEFPPSDDAPTWSASGQGLVEPDRSTGEVELPHWTEPPTGEVPRILPGVEPEEAEVDEDLESWASISGQTPRYRSEAGDWAEGDWAEPEALKDEGVALGALAEGDVDDDEDFEERVAARRRPRRGRSGPGRGRPHRGSLETDEAPSQPLAGFEGELTTRVLTGVGIAVVSLLLLAAGDGPAAFLVMGIVGLAAFELYDALRRAGYQPATILGILGSVAMVWLAYKSDDYGLQAFPLVTALVVVFTMLWYMAEVVKARPIVNTAITVFGFAYVGILGGFAGLLLSHPDGTGIILGLAICAVGYDVFGFFVGSQFGRSKLAPRLSPNKTWEGLFGGMAAAIILGGIVSKGVSLAPWDGKLAHGLALGLVVAILAPLGDLGESMIKRDLGVKDLGTILPGHGGILDRFDAILFCLPGVYYLVFHLGI